MHSAVFDSRALSRQGREPRLTLADATAYTRGVGARRDDHFTAPFFLLPRDLRSDFANVYAFYRCAEALSNAPGDSAQALERLAEWRGELAACYAGEATHPVFIALQDTVAKHRLPREPFDQIVDAFVRDQHVTRIATWDELLTQCGSQANPLGRLVLHLVGQHDETRGRLSDAACTASQLSRFWQNVRGDAIARQRVRLPEDVARRHGLDLTLMAKAIRLDATSAAERGRGCCSACDLPSVGITALRPMFRATMHELVERTRPLFAEGRRLWPMLERRFQSHWRLHIYGGEAILRMIERARFDTLTRQPRLGQAARLGLVARAAAATLGR